MGAVREALAGVTVLNRPDVWAGVEIELDEMRRQELEVVLGDVEGVLGMVRELLERLADAVREFGHIPGEHVDEAVIGLWPVTEAIVAASWDLGRKAGAVS